MNEGTGESTPHPDPMAPSRPLGRPSTGLRWSESLPPPPQATEVPGRGGEGMASDGGLNFGGALAWSPASGVWLGFGIGLGGKDAEGLADLVALFQSEAAFEEGSGAFLSAQALNRPICGRKSQETFTGLYKT